MGALDIDGTKDTREDAAESINNASADTVDAKPEESTEHVKNDDDDDTRKGTGRYIFIRNSDRIYIFALCFQEKYFFSCKIRYSK